MNVTVTPGPIWSQMPFTEKVRHDFSCYVYLGLNFGRYDQEKILNIIISQEGYECHKIIQYGIYWSHLYIRFQNGDCASKSVATFREMGKIFSVEIVKHLLVTLHSIELTRYYGRMTTALIDFFYKEQSLGVPIDTEVFGSIVKEFGYPKMQCFVRHYVTESILHFTTLAEAVGATIALGMWSRGYKAFPNHPYAKIKILMRKKEANVIQRICATRGIPPATIKLDYFLSPNMVHQAWRCMCGTSYPRSEDYFSRRDFRSLHQEQAQDGDSGNTLNSTEHQNSSPGTMNDVYPSFFDQRNSILSDSVCDRADREHVLNPSSDFITSDLSYLERAHQSAYLSYLQILSTEVRPATQIPRENVAVSSAPVHVPLQQNQLSEGNFHVLQPAPITHVLPSTNNPPPPICKNIRTVYSKRPKRNFNRKNRVIRKERSAT